MSPASPPGQRASLDDWLGWQLSVNPVEIDLRLERVARVLERLALELPPSIITVGGTNGKGSTVAMLESLLRAQGLACGAYTSPHLVRYNERIRVRGTAADDRCIVAAFQDIESERGGLPLTYFEFGTLAALRIFAAEKLDVALLEVGLGGRLDAVNALEPSGVIITSVALDHQSWLGETREAIGAEKAGIMRAGRPAVFSGSDIPASILAAAESIGANLHLRDRDYRFEEKGAVWAWQGAGIEYPALARPALAGSHQIANAAGALALLEALGLLDGIDAGLVSDGLRRVCLDGRFHKAAYSPDWIVDVAHNPAAAQSLLPLLKSSRVEGRTFALIGMLKDKDIAGTVNAIEAEVDGWFATGVEADRGMAGAELAAIVANLTNQPCEFFETPQAAIERIQALASPRDRVLAFGSFYLAGPVLEALRLYSTASDQNEIHAGM